MGTVPIVRDCMKPIPLNIGVEDLLSEIITRRLIRDSGRNYSIGTVFSRGGFGYLKKTAHGWNSASKSIPFFLLTDLDTSACPSQLIVEWVPGTIHHNFFFRVAVREVEAWLIADYENLSYFLQVRKAKFPEHPELLDDAKGTLIAIASSSSSRQVRERIVPKLNSFAKQGRDYNACLGEFVDTEWNPQKAAARAPSLYRCIERLRNFDPEW